ncbi:MAG: malto-oligosyltrehalose trehalohydrolase [Candidatus Rokubacteria bacterium]|nr:malto-oligosyltrehalose trehalohydrolase [Candidatus Rokubacteria bacterium]
MGRRRALPFGAQVDADGTTRFRLWAPAAERVDLWLEDTGHALPMARDAEGWAELVTPEAPAGSRYRFRIDGAELVPDPASRFQPEDVHGPSEVVDPLAHGWADTGWAGRRPEELVVYELHLGTFSPAGTFAGAIAGLDHVASLGATAVEIMPVGEFPGGRGWGYDGVLLFAPESRYGRPEDLKRLVEACHARGLAVILDVVYNHFGPEGNYLGRYAPGFFSGRRTPWGDALNFDGPGAGPVRRFMVENALYWLEEFDMDGLRLDAVHAIHDRSEPHIVAEITRAIAAGPGRRRPLHLILENDDNTARWLTRGSPAVAQWNDDLHHGLHVLVTGERDGYYADHEPAIPALGRALAEGFTYQGERSAYRKRPRGEPSAALPPTAFVNFLQNHDQIGNRALGERITDLAAAEAVRAATAVLLLAPALPMLFMGEDWAAPEPFLYFSELGPDLGPAVTEGRRREFRRFREFADPAARARIPDPQAPDTMRRSVLDWTRLARPAHREWVEFHRMLLGVRRQEVVPLLAGDARPAAEWTPIGEAEGAAALGVTWRFPGRGTLRLVMNLGTHPAAHRGPGPDWGRRIYALGIDAVAWETLPPWSLAAYLEVPG